jgi:glycosyltransferase involved in cell wall biosynthesis
LRNLPFANRRQRHEEVAVVIPTRDRWPLMRMALASALAQEDVDARVVVVDDGSIDETADELGAIDDGRVRVLRHDRPEGVSSARNLGLAHVAAPWVAFLDDDDVWGPGYLAAMLHAAEASDLDRERVGLVYSGHLTVDRERQVTGVSQAPPAEDVRSGMDRFNFVGCPSRVVLRTDVVREVGGFDVRLSVIADWDLWVRVVAKRDVVRCPDLLVGYMRHPGNMHLDADGFLDELAVMQSKHGWDRGLALPGDILPAYVASAYRASGRRLSAARWYLRAFRVQRTPRDLGRAVGVLFGERIIGLSGLREHTTVDPSLGRWLEPLRQAERATPRGLPSLPARRKPSTDTRGHVQPGHRAG